MSSLEVLNKAIDRAAGSGLPIYENINSVFSVENNMFNSQNGLLTYPNNKVPAFQLHTSNIYTQVDVFKYRETNGANDFTGFEFIPPSGPQRVREYSRPDGSEYAVWQTSDDGTLIVPAKQSRWIRELTSSDGAAQSKTFYSEEFLTCF